MSTFQIDKRVRESAALVGDTLLVGKLSKSDMIALEAKYHSRCLMAQYNCVRICKAYSKQSEPQVVGIAFEELAKYIEDTRLEASTAPIVE